MDNDGNYWNYSSFFTFYRLIIVKAKLITAIVHVALENNIADGMYLSQNLFLWNMPHLPNRRRAK